MDFYKIISVIEEIAPKALSAEWDNSGVQIDVGKKDIKKVLVALEITKAVIEGAKENDIDMIITHHPLIFEPLYKVDSNTVTGNQITELIKAGISVYTAHTNFDAATGGNNDYIASLMKLVHVKRFKGDSIGRTGELLVKMSFKEVCAYVKESLKLKYITASGNPDAKIRKVGVSCGSGGDMIDAAIESGCDLLITGDVKYHAARYAQERGICIIDAGHYGTEKFFAENMAVLLSAKIGGKAEIISSALDTDPFYIC